MLHKFQNFILDNKLFKSSDTILLAVSGGVDSMVMTELFDLGNFKYSIAHCNYGLRGKESDEDENFVLRIAKKNVRFHNRKFDTKKFAAKEKISVQMAARNLRQQWFRELINEFGYAFYATAHHQDDQIETFFINLLRGSGISGLHGILPKSGNQIHPMLFSNRVEIEEFARVNGVSYRNDSSNFKTDYLRNKIRLQLLPVLKTIQKDYATVITGNIERLKQAEQIYFQQINVVKNNLLMASDEELKIPVDGLRGLKPIDTYLFEILEPYNFQFSDIKNIIHSLDSQTGKKFFSRTHKLVREREFLIISMLKPDKNPDQKFIINKDTHEVRIPFNLTVTQIVKSAGFQILKNPNIAMLDAERIVFPLEIRHWRKGDYFFPLGMNHKKLVSDFFTDNKFSASDKERTWLLCSGSDILWIIRHRIDERFKVTVSTKKILKLELEV
jgi:tRNA(Ile)-lysidine synthase